MIMEQPYIKFICYDTMSYYCLYKPLKPTGKWRIVYELGSNVPNLEIEHKNWFLKEWISEDSIEWLTPKRVIENKCN